ncbi:MAG: segregation/condensation protein A [Phycisphaerales bacterium]|nr:segregation/condensation protein A [Phycisphaerales bacterium]
MVTHDYTVRLEAFEGPLDLLLHLIRRAEVDITEISIARITEQYLAYLQQVDRIDVDVAGEFLVTAATLVEIKSRVLSPVEGGGPGGPGETSASQAAALAEAEADNPAAQLIRQLLAYKVYREAGERLERQREEWERRYPSGRAGFDAPDVTPDELDIEDLEVYDLLQAFRKIVETVQFDRLGAHEITDDETPIELHIEDLRDRLKGGVPEVGLPMVEVFRGRRRAEMVGLFLALLEMVRRRELRVQQDRTTDQIVLWPRPAEDRTEQSAG